MLLKTRARHALNYMRAKFDRVTIIYIFLISLVALYLAGRSPADIGYGLEMLSQNDFHLKWLAFVLNILFIFYFFSESMAYLTLRPTAGLSLLGSLPIENSAIINYSLIRHFLKTAGVFLLIIFPFWIGASPFGDRVLIFITITILLLAIQLGAYMQAYRLRQYFNQKVQTLRRWFLFELVAFALSYFVPNMVSIAEVYGNSWAQVLFLLLAVSATGYFYRLVQKSHVPLFTESGKVVLTQKKRALFSPKTGLHYRSTTVSLILHDLYFLQKKKKTLFILQALGLFLSFMVSVYNDSPENAFGGLLFIQGVLSFFMINALMELFRRDADVFSLLRSLSLSASKYWWARWVFASLMLALPFIIPNLIILMQFRLESSHIGLIVLSLAVLPGLFALIYCNAGFGTFPHVNFGANMMNISLALIIFMWFYVPFGSMMILGIALLWVRKSIRNIKILELE
ncbi:MAG: hypothetical protein ACE5I1_12205 [bacterium]